MAHDMMLKNSLHFVTPLPTSKIEYIISYFDDQPNTLPPVESIAGWLLE